MSKSKHFSEIERERYNTMSSKMLMKMDNNLLRSIGSNNFKDYYREPYLDFEIFIKNNVNENHKVLDLCCGNGIHSFTIVKTGAKVLSYDYSEQSINIARKRHELIGGNISFNVGDVNSLELKDQFDFIICIGSLSYVDNNILISNLKKWLKPKGQFIFIDSFNHNIFYRTNRFFRFLKNQRSWSLNKSIPNKNTVKIFSQNFKINTIRYYGTFLFITPILKLFFSEKLITKIIKFLDFKFLKLYAFKIFCIVENNVK